MSTGRKVSKKSAFPNVYDKIGHYFEVDIFICD